METLSKGTKRSKCVLNDLVSYWPLQFITVRETQVALLGKNPPANAGDTRGAGSIPGSGGSLGGGNGNPLQYSCLEVLWAEEPGGLQSMGLQRVGHE